MTEELEDLIVRKIFAHDARMSKPMRSCRDCGAWRPHRPHNDDCAYKLLEAVIAEEIMGRINDEASPTPK